MSRSSAQAALSASRYCSSNRSARQPSPVIGSPKATMSSSGKLGLRELEDGSGLPLGCGNLALIDGRRRHLALCCLELRLHFLGASQRAWQLIEAVDDLAEVPVRISGVGVPVDMVEVEEDARS